MKELEIEWRHLDEGGNICVRCAETGKALAQAMADLKAECEPKGVHIVFRETKLSGDEIERSNQILFNGIAIEQLLPGAASSTTYCSSCCEFTEQETFCRTVEYCGESYEAIPGELVREAACRIANCC